MARTLHSALLLLLPILLFSQNVEFQLYTTEDGLSNNAIWGMTQDKQGFIWAADENGLERFDGQHFLNLSNAGSAAFPKCKKAWKVVTKAIGMTTKSMSSIPPLTIPSLSAACPAANIRSG
jgi:ligand-binding sensor domain-containing protein